MKNQNLWRVILLGWRCIFADLLYLTSDKDDKELIDADLERYARWDSWQYGSANSRYMRLHMLLIYEYPFRNIFYYRTKNNLLRKLSKLVLRPLPTVEIGGGKIGPGFMIHHHSCVVFPEKAGRNFRVGPGAVIGQNGGRYPVFGDDVYVAGNASVIGNVHIGNRVIIGAGAVVTHDIPDDSVYGGNPAKFICSMDERLRREIE